MRKYRIVDETLQFIGDAAYSYEVSSGDYVVYIDRYFAVMSRIWHEKDSIVYIVCKEVPSGRLRFQ